MSMLVLTTTDPGSTVVVRAEAVQALVGPYQLAADTPPVRAIVVAGRELVIADTVANVQAVLMALTA